MRALRVLTLCSLLLLAACNTVAKRPAGPPAPPADPQQLQTWRATGRIGVSGEGGGGSGSFDWQQQADAANVQIRGPIGIGSVTLQLSGDPDNPQLRLQTGDQVLESEQAVAELEARLGAAVPAGRLRYWMLGVAAP